MEELFLAVLERFTARLIVRQRAMYAADTTFLVKWRKAMGFLEEDLAAGYPKILLELQAMGWNRPPMRKRIAAVLDEWRHGAHRGFPPAMEHYGIADGPLGVEAMVALVMTFNEGHGCSSGFRTSASVTPRCCARSIAGSCRLNQKRGAR